MASNRNHREEIQRLMLDVMVDTLKDIQGHSSLVAQHKLDNVTRWMKVMRSMMPEQMEQALDDIVKELESQKPK